jgi:hypothetical protein
MSRLKARVFACCMLFAAFGCSPDAKARQNRGVPDKNKDTVEVGVSPVVPLGNTLKPSQQIVRKSYTNLSRSFNFRATLHRSGDQIMNEFDRWVRLEIFDKNDSLLQTIRNLETWDFYDDLNDVRSYETHFRDKLPAADEYFGKLVVGDFNQDSLSDIALIMNVPVSGTPTYYFYMQKPSGKFERDDFFTKTVGYIPYRPDFKKHTFHTRSHYGCCVGVRKYYAADSLGNWRKTRTIERDLSDD